MKFNLTTESQRAQRRIFCLPEADNLLFETIGHPGLTGETAANENIDALTKR
jgi:hypothetical protein